MLTKTYTIAVDFDGTIVEDAYPKIGKPKLFAFETMKALQERGHQLILWTYRDGKHLEEAVTFCKEHGIIFYAINKSYPEEVYTNSISRKINADYFIDDRNIGGLLEWGQIHQLLVDKNVKRSQQKRKKNWLGF